MIMNDRKKTEKKEENEVDSVDKVKKRKEEEREEREEKEEEEESERVKSSFTFFWLLLCEKAKRKFVNGGVRTHAPEETST